MKTLLGTFVLFFAMSAQADHCDKHAISHKARLFGQQGMRFEQLIETAHGYEHLDLDAHELHTRSEALSHAAVTGASCEMLDRDFHDMERTFQHLGYEHQRAQSLYPNSYISHAFSDLDRAFHQLDSAMHTPSIVTVNVRCESSNYMHRDCPVHGRIVGAQLAQQLSSMQCVQGRSWGMHQNAIWVDRGCRGVFRVSMYPMH